MANAHVKTERRPVGRFPVLVLAGALVLAGTAGFVARMSASPDFVFLRAEAGARWIGIARRLNLAVWPEGAVSTRFRTRFEVAAVPPEALLRVRALRSAAVYLDGRLVLPGNFEFDEWKRSRNVDLAPWLTPGVHELVVSVVNQDGPALLLAHCAALGIATAEDGGWSSSPDGERWKVVADVDSRPLPKFFDDFPSSRSALAAHWPLFALLVALTGALTLLASSRAGSGTARRPAWLGASQVRWALLLAWLVLAVNSLCRVPLDFGFDWNGHAEYIRYVAERWRLPLATEGWQMFQSPLYYMVAALPYAALSPAAAESPADLPRALLVIPLVCGALQIQLAYAATRRVFPQREDLQALGTLVGGFLPINLYSSQHIGNEPFAALLSASALVVAMGLLAPGRTADRGRDWALLGALVGLALLAKATAVLLVPPLVLTLGWKHWSDHRDARSLAARLGLMLGVALLICGWHYARNWIEMGTPILNGTEATRWWQDPGYRTPRDLYAFGAALDQPLYAGVRGLWNGLYSTLWSDGLYSGKIPNPRTVKPWNEDFLIVGPLFGILPSIALGLGMLRSPRQPQTVMALLTVLTFLAAIAYVYLKVPHYWVPKASYTLGLLPSYAVLAATGLEPLTRRPLARAVVVALLMCGAVSAYVAYFAAP